MAKVVLLLLTGAVIVGIGQGIDNFPGVGWWLVARALHGVGFICLFCSGVIYERGAET